LLAALVARGTARAWTADEAWSAYEKRWASTQSYTAAFRQRIEITGVDGPVESAGRFYFARPDLMRWDYAEGQRQVVVGDGRDVWIYQPELEQVYRVEYATAFGSGGLVTLLAGREGLSARYRTELLEAGMGKLKIRLLPKDGVGEMLDLTMTADTMDLISVTVTDPAGSVTYVEFDDPVRNAAVEKGLFRFSPPVGVDVIDSTPPPAAH
jgi:outer membrane lipoprotein carrier protein